MFFFSSESAEEEGISVPTIDKLRMMSDFEACRFSNYSEIIASYGARQFSFRKPKRGLGLMLRDLTEQSLRDLKIVENLTESCAKSMIR